MSTATKETFVKSVIGNGFKIINSVGMRKLESGAVAKLSICTGGTHNQYEGLQVVIMDVRGGVLDSQKFMFDDLLKIGSRKPDAAMVEGFKVIPHCGWQWYINTPTTSSIKLMNRTIIEYVSMFE